MAKLISKTYGEALYELSTEKSITDSLFEEVMELKKLLNDNPEFEALMANPQIPGEDKVKIVHDVFDQRASEELIGFMELLLSKGRFASIIAVFDYYIERVKEEEGIGTAYVTTAVLLSKQQEQEIEKKLLESTSYKKMEIFYNVDAALIGGMKIRIKDRVVDSSIQTKLEEMERTLRKIQLSQ